jgi:hypothetical protein
MNPPHFHLLILPLALLGPLPAVLLWAALNIGALVVGLRLIARELGLAWTWSGLGWTLFAVAVSAATGTIVLTGQVTFVIMLPFTLAWVAARRGRWTTAGVYLGVVVSLKPFLAIFAIYLLATRRLAAAVTMALTGALCCLVGLIIFGPHAYVAWLGALSAVDWTWAPMNVSITALVARTLGENPVYAPLLHAPALVRPVSLVLAALVALTSLLLVIRDRSGESADRAFGILTLASLLASPLGWVYYLPLVTGPALALWQSSRARRFPLRDLLVGASVVGLVTPLFATVWLRDRAWWTPTLGSIYVWTTLALWTSVLLDGHRRSARADRAATAA